MKHTAGNAACQLGLGFLERGRSSGLVTTGDRGWLFTAIDPRVEDLHASSFSSPAEADRVARLVLDRARGAGGVRL